MPNIIEKISGLLEKVTRGPLYVSLPVRLGKDGGKHGYREICSEVSVFWVARFQAFADGSFDKVSPEWEANAELYCELRNAAPALMDVVRAAKEYIDNPSVGAHRALRSKLAALENL